MKIPASAARSAPTASASTPSARSNPVCTRFTARKPGFQTVARLNVELIAGGQMRLDL